MVVDAIGQVLSFAVGVAISPVPIIAVVLMLATPRGRGNGIAFLVGWIGGLALAGGIVLALAGGAGADDAGAPASWVSLLKLALGIALLLVAFRQWRGRPAPGSDAELPGWMQRIDAFGPPQAAGMAALLAAVNPKNLLLTVGAAAAIAQTGAATGGQAVALAVFVAIASLGPGVPLAIYLALGDRAGRLLDGLKTWMSTNNAAIMAVLCLVIAAKLVGDGISGLG